MCHWHNNATAILHAKRINWTVCEINKLFLRIIIKIASTTPLISSSRLDRFIFLRFSYSSAACVPDFFTSSQFGGGSLVLPEQMGTLIARLHSISTIQQSGRHRDEAQIEHQADLGELNRAIAAFQSYASREPNWAAERFDVGKTEERGVVKSSNLINF